MKIHSEGRKIIPVAYVIIVLADLTVWYFLKGNPLSYIFIGLSVVLAGLVVWFFRVPNRVVITDPNHILAPSDGEIVEILETEVKEYFNGKRLQVSIFMSPLNVHQNKAPVSGDIVYQHHKRGVFYPAFVKKSSEKNERCSTVFRMANGVEVMSRQIAGTVARRITTSKKEGDFAEQGQEYGFIRFGSRVDLFLPADVEVCVHLHQKSVGGTTVIAKFSEQ
jgi:phosphatidylserine decarboxylase